MVYFILHAIGNLDVNAESYNTINLVDRLFWNLFGTAI